MEQPLPTGPPTGPFPGAQWKAQLCFQEDASLHVFVMDVSSAGRSLWPDKYRIRSAMASASGQEKLSEPLLMDKVRAAGLESSWGRALF